MRERGHFHVIFVPLHLHANHMLLRVHERRKAPHKCPICDLALPTEQKQIIHIKEVHEKRNLYMLYL